MTKVSEGKETVIKKGKRQLSLLKHSSPLKLKPKEERKCLKRTAFLSGSCFMEEESCGTTFVGVFKCGRLKQRRKTVGANRLQ